MKGHLALGCIGALLVFVVLGVVCGYLCEVLPKKKKKSLWMEVEVLDQFPQLLLVGRWQGKGWHGLGAGGCKVGRARGLRGTSKP